MGFNSGFKGLNNSSGKGELLIFCSFGLFWNSAPPSLDHCAVVWSAKMAAFLQYRNS